MAENSTPKGPSAGVDKSFLAERKGQAKSSFDRAQTGDVSKAAEARSGGVGDSIRKSAPTPALDMPGGGAIKAHYAGERVQNEKVAEKLKQDAAKMAAKKLTKSNDLSQNNSNSSEKGRE